MQTSTSLAIITIPPRDGAPFAGYFFFPMVVFTPLEARFMRWVSCLILTFVLTLGFSVQAQAGPMLAVSSSANLNNLKVGQTVTFDVTLSGIETMDWLDYLAATLTYNKTLLSSPLSVPAGPIVPDLTGFSGVGNVGLVDGNYDDIIADTKTPITTNGVFFSFDVKVTGTGSGTVGFSFVDSVGFHSNGEIVGFLPTVTAGNPITFDIPASTAIPEPTSLVLLGIGGVGIFLAQRKRLTRSRKSELE